MTTTLLCAIFLFCSFSTKIAKTTAKASMKKTEKVTSVVKNGTSATTKRVECDIESPKYINFFHKTKLPSNAAIAALKVIANSGFIKIPSNKS